MTQLLNLLKQQDALLDDILNLLGDEFDILRQRKALALPDIATRKQTLLAQLQHNDEQIGQQPDVDKLASEFAEHRSQLEDKMRECQERNEVNGRLIEMNLLSNRQLTRMLVQIRDKNSMTYDQKGNPQAAGGLNMNFKV